MANLDIAFAGEAPPQILSHHRYAKPLKLKGGLQASGLLGGLCWASLHVKCHSTTNRRQLQGGFLRRHGAGGAGQSLPV